MFLLVLRDREPVCFFCNEAGHEKKMCKKQKRPPYQEIKETNVEYGMKNNKKMNTKMKQGAITYRKGRRKEMFYLTTHSTHFIYGYMALDIW